MYAIQVSNLTKSFGSLVAVDNVSLDVRKGEIFGLLGPNGAGKTTLIHTTLGVYKADSGHVKVLGYEIPQEKLKARKRTGFMPQELAIYTDLTPLDNALFYGRLYGLSDGEILDRVEELYDLLALKEKMNTPCHKLSGGQKRRVSLGIALLTNPDLLLLDEPTVGVDPILRKDFWNHFGDIKKQGKTLLITTHITDEAMRTDRVALMNRGKIILEGPPTQLMNEHSVDTLEDLFLIFEKGGKE